MAVVRAVPAATPVGPVAAFYPLVRAVQVVQAVPAAWLGLLPAARCPLRSPHASEVA